MDAHQSNSHGVDDLGRDHAPSHARQKSSLSKLVIQPVAHFRESTATIPAANSPVKRKALPANSPVLSRYSSAEYKGIPRTFNPQRSISLDGPLSHPQPAQHRLLTPIPSGNSDKFLPRDLDQ